MNRFGLALVCVGVVTVAPLSARAQQPAQMTYFSLLVGAAVPRTERLGGVDVGAGPSTGLAIVGSLGLRPFRSPLSFRLDAQYARLGLDDEARIELGGDAPVVAGGTAHVLSATGNVVLSVASTHRVRPYVIGGVGIYHLSSDVEIRTPAGRPVVNSAPSESENQFGLNGGAGIELAIGSLRTIVEARYHGMFTEGRTASLVPITVGLRF